MSVQKSEWSIEYRDSAPFQAPSKFVTSVWKGEHLEVSKAGVGDATQYRWICDGLAEALISPLDRNVLLWPTNSETSQTTLEHFWYDGILPALLALDGTLVLHAGAIQIGGRAVAITGPSGRGKSTLVASFLQAGFPILGDDALTVETTGFGAHASSVYPSLRLLPDSLSAVFSEPPVTTSMAHYSSKQHVKLPLKPKRLVEPFPLAAVWVLAEPTASGRISSRRLSQSEACIALISNSFALDPSDTQAAIAKLAQAGRLSDYVAVFEITYPREYPRLREVRREILHAIERSK